MSRSGDPVARCDELVASGWPGATNVVLLAKCLAEAGKQSHGSEVAWIKPVAIGEVDIDPDEPSFRRG